MTFGRRHRYGASALLAALMLSLGGLPSPSRAEDAPGQPERLVNCGSRLSLDKRMHMQQWAAPGACAQPVKTRVIDRFLGFSCLEQGTDAAACRAFVPVANSRAFNTANFYRCFDLGVTGSMEGIEINRIREWAGKRDQCNWDPNADVLAMEVDFENGQVCAATLCMPVERLSAIGKVRLRQLLASAFRELDPASQAAGPQGVGPVRADAGSR